MRARTSRNIREVEVGRRKKSDVERKMYEREKKRKQRERKMAKPMGRKETIGLKNMTAEEKRRYNNEKKRESRKRILEENKEIVGKMAALLEKIKIPR